MIAADDPQQHLFRGALRLPDDPVRSLAQQGPAAVDHAAPFLPELDPASEAPALVTRHGSRVELDPKVALASDGGAEIERLAAACRMAGAGADVRAHDLGWHEGEEAALHRHTRDRVDIVAGPEPVGIGGNPCIDPAAAARAAFDLDLGMRGAQAFQQGVGAAGLRRSAGRGVVAVVVPLEVGNLRSGQQGIERTEQIVPHILPPQVEHQLVARGRPLAPVLGKHPVGMHAVELAIGIDHFRLHPEPEFHAEAAHLVGQRGDALRVFARIGSPVAEACAVMVAAPEPAIVEDEAFGPDLRSGLRKRHNPGLVMREIDRFPAVEMHRARAHRAARPGDPVTQGPVHLRHRAVAAAGRDGDEQRRSRAALARLQDRLARLERGFCRGDPEPFVVALYCQPCIARPAKLNRDDETGVPA